jgi:hypothetical protein
MKIFKTLLYKKLRPETLFNQEKRPLQIMAFILMLLQSAKRQSAKRQKVTNVTHWKLIVRATFTQVDEDVF